MESATPEALQQPLQTPPDTTGGGNQPEHRGRSTPEETVTGRAGGSEESRNEDPQYKPLNVTTKGLLEHVGAMIHFSPANEQDLKLTGSGQLQCPQGALDRGVVSRPGGPEVPGPGMCVVLPPFVVYPFPTTVRHDARCS